MPSSTARRSRSTLVGAGRPTSTYFARIRSRYSRAVECAMPSCIANELQRQAGCVEVQHVALAPAELRLGEVAVGLDRARPLDVVEHLALRDQRDGADHRRHRGAFGMTPAAPAASASRTAATRSAMLCRARRCRSRARRARSRSPRSRRRARVEHDASHAPPSSAPRLGNVRGLGDHLVAGVETCGAHPSRTASWSSTIATVAPCAAPSPVTCCHLSPTVTR